MIPKSAANTEPATSSAHTLMWSPGSVAGTATEKMCTLWGANCSVANQPAM